jgi:hypothetical protein
MSLDNTMGSEILENEILFDIEERLCLPINTFRYKFSEEFMVDLYNFAKIHQYDDRESFKEAWKVWSTENEEIVKKEMDELTKNNYTGDIMDKMFKSARYYFRKKSTEKKEPKERRKYIHVDEGLLKCMDMHIIKNINNSDYQPKNGFEKFCNENYEPLKATVQNICKSGMNDPKIIQEKIKKTYKNRYFILVHTSKNCNL